MEEVGVDDLDRLDDDPTVSWLLLFIVAVITPKQQMSFEVKVNQFLPVQLESIFYREEKKKSENLWESHHFERTFTKWKNAT